VQRIATKNLKMIADTLDPRTIVTSLLPIINNIVHNGNEDLRTAVSESALSLAPLLSQDYIKEYLLGIYSALLRDESVDVRMNLLRTFHELSGVRILDHGLGSPNTYFGQGHPPGDY